MSPEREHRLEEITEAIQERGKIDRAELQSMIERMYGVSWATARGYVDDLVRRGVAVARFGTVQLRFDGDDSAPADRTATEER